MASIDYKSDLQPINRRGNTRSRTIKTGKLLYGGFTPSVADCLIIDISDNGARVETSVMVHIPDILMLQINGSNRPVRRVWAMGNQIGLEFLDLPIT